MTSIVRPFKPRWTSEQRRRISAENAPAVGMVIAFEEMERDAERLCSEARQRIERERDREQSR